MNRKRNPKRATLKRNAPLPKSRRPVKKKNVERRAKNFARAYGSKERVEFVKALPCLSCGRRPSENAHLPHPYSGMGYKGPYTAIVALCHACHEAKVYLRNPIYYHASAERIERMWQAHPRQEFSCAD